MMLFTGYLGYSYLQADRKTFCKKKVGTKPWICTLKKIIGMSYIT